MNPAQLNMHTSDTDRPLDDPQADELGFVEMAEKLAPSILRCLDTDGIVIGIEGEWGSGKTTLANYLLKEVERQAESSVEIVRLSPWLSGDADTLVGSLLQAIAVTVENRSIGDQSVEDNGRPVWKVFLKRYSRKITRWFKKIKRASLTNLLNRYAQKTARAVSPLSTAGDILLPGIGMVGRFFEAISNFFKSVTEPSTAADLKAKISAHLKKADCRFIVLIDDLDRLEPSLAVEVVRLVRSVADFPKVLYIMCYDRAVLTRALEVGLNVDDGYRFLRKIVQQAFSIPLPEPFDLRLSLVDKAICFFSEFHNRAPTDLEGVEIREAINEWGINLRTPRDVKLVMNAISFAYSPVSNYVYYPDVCRLQLIKVVLPRVYEWLEGYLSEYSVVVTGDGHVGQQERYSIAEKLLGLFPDKDDPESPRSVWRIQQIVPGIDMQRLGEQPEFVFQRVHEQDLVRLAKNRRLGSPYHYRYYFALSGPRTVLSDADVDTLLIEANNGSVAVRRALAELYSRPRRHGGNWLSQLFDRFNGAFVSSLNEHQLENLFIGIADLMDDVLDRGSNSRMLHHAVAHRGDEAIGYLYREWRHRDPNSADEAMIKLVAKAPSINWIVGEFFRREMYDHGRVDPARAATESEWLMSAEVFERALGALQERIAQHMRHATLRQFPDLSGFIFGWRELSGNDVVREWIMEQTEQDSDFVYFLLQMRSWSVGNRVYRPLPSKYLVDFMDISQLYQRLERIKDTAADETLQEQAKEVLEALELGKHR
ncbi:KAP family P-loop NTPase fold protein [Castellaniella ginsengisoli]